MKKLLLIALLFSAAAQAQVYNGKGDIKLQIGANLQKDGSGIILSSDFGLAENLSFGVSGSYLLGTATYGGVPKFSDRFDAKARLNAHLGSILNISDGFDLYPGLNLGLKNFGGHVGARYFFSPSFGIYTEAVFPIAKYKNNLVNYDYLNNQFAMNVGTSFNL